MHPPPKVLCEPRCLLDALHAAAEVCETGSDLDTTVGDASSCDGHGGMLASAVFINAVSVSDANQMEMASPMRQASK